MKQGYFFVAGLLVSSMMAQAVANPAFADLRSAVDANRDQRYIRVIQNKDQSIRFEICPLASSGESLRPLPCKLLGDRDYSQFELRRKRQQMIDKANTQLGTDIVFVVVTGAVAGGLAILTTMNDAKFKGLGMVAVKGALLVGLGAAVPNLLFIARGYMVGDTNPLKDKKKAQTLLAEAVITNGAVQATDRTISQMALELDEILKTIR